MNCLWSCLHYEQLSCIAVFGPFGIHRRPLAVSRRVVFFNKRAPQRQLFCFFVGKYKGIPLFLRSAYYPGLFDLLAASAPINHLPCFCSKPLKDKRVRRILKCLFGHHKLIRRYLTLNYHLAKTPRSVDYNYIRKTRLGIKREHHSRTSFVGTNHPLYSYRKRASRKRKNGLPPGPLLSRG